MIGAKIKHDGMTLFSPDYNSDGLSFGRVFKDKDAFENEPNEVCYIPEYGFFEEEPITIEGKDFYNVDGYTRKDLENMILDERGMPIYQDDDGEKLTIERFFSILLWAYPETYVNEFE